MLSRFILAVVLFANGGATASDLRDFASDGCSLFPEGDLGRPTLWCDCCLAHDIAYWQGGTEEQRRHADEALQACVLARTGSRTLADLMYQGVRVGGYPLFPTWYRWGYGWAYGKGYAPLTEDEQREVRAKLDAYYRTQHPAQCAPQ